MFSLQNLLRKNIKELKPYSSARDEFQGVASVYLDANENPFDTGLNRYPDPLQMELKNRISSIKKVFPEQIFMGNGSDEAIDLLFRAFCEPGIDNVVAIKPTYGMYKVCADINNVEYNEVLLGKDFNLVVNNVLKAVNENTKLVFLCSPNNPTGNSLAEVDIIHLLDSFDGMVVLDEAYIEFGRQKSFLSKLADYPNLVVLQTFSKAWGMAGIRLGMAFGSNELIKVLNNIKYPYNVNVLTQKEALTRLKSVHKVQKQVDTIIDERIKLINQLKDLSFVLKIYPSDANFVLIQVEDSLKTYDYLLEKEIIVRDRSKVALCEGCLRITIGTKKENASLIKALLQFQK